VRSAPELPRRIWRVASGAAAAIEGAAIASNLMVRWLQPIAAHHDGRPELPAAAPPTQPQAERTDDERLELVREIEACDVRLRLLPPADGTALDASFRRELQQRRDVAAARLESPDTTF
jgi:hypothetical protein